VSLFGPTDVLDVRDGAVEESEWRPEDFGLATRPADDEAELVVDGPEESAGAIREVLAGGRGPRREIVLLNAAAVLWAVGRADSLPAARELAERAIDSGDAAVVLGRLAAASRDAHTAATPPHSPIPAHRS
jgi:anthranilate phosphoribosyltransferase